MTEFTHLPPRIRKALDDYDSEVENGELTFSGEFADMPEPDPGGWVRNLLSSHLPVMDISPSPPEPPPDPYPELREGGFGTGSYG